MKIKKSELKQMIREAIREELRNSSLREASFNDPEMQRKRQKFQDWLRGREIVNEDGLMSSLGRYVDDCLGDCQVPGPDGKSQWTYSGNKLRSKRSTPSNGLVSVYTYTLAHDIPEDFISNGATGYSDLKQGFKKLQQYPSAHTDCIKLKHDLKCEADRGNGYILTYTLTIIPDWDKCVFWSDSYPDARRGQTPEDVRGYGIKLPD